MIAVVTFDVIRVMGWGCSVGYEGERGGVASRVLVVVSISSFVGSLSSKCIVVVCSSVMIGSWSRNVMNALSWRSTGVDWWVVVDTGKGRVLVLCWVACERKVFR